MIKSISHPGKENQRYQNDFEICLICINVAQNIEENLWSFSPVQAFFN